MKINTKAERRAKKKREKHDRVGITKMEEKEKETTNTWRRECRNKRDKQKERRTKVSKEPRR